MEALTWSPAHEGNEGTWWGFRGRFLAAQVAYYDHVGGSGLPGWVGYVVGHRVTGRCDSPELARRLVDERATG